MSGKKSKRRLFRERFSLRLDMRLTVAFVALLISIGLLIIAQIWIPPAAAQFRTVQALRTKNAVTFEADVSLELPYLQLPSFKGQAKLSLDFLKKQGIVNLDGLVDDQKNNYRFKGDLRFAEDGDYIRVSFLPLKIINNQWIKLDAPPETAQTLFALFDAVSHVVLDRRLSNEKQAHYSFEFKAPPSALRDFKGEIMLNSKTWLPAGLHIQAKLGKSEKASEITVRQISFEPVWMMDAPSGFLAVAEVFPKLENAALFLEKIAMPSSLTSPRISIQQFSADFDGDHLPDTIEQVYGTDPANPDSDDDEHLDGDEIENGYNPLGNDKIGGDMR
ncbi:MAG: Ricin B lectin [Parcubacteria group bacterium GW2011_GWC2_45_7]|nr:MAG: Ricin B lectin [Parcubacteria group bacterium GW2011_GWC2_45_7]KKU73350.1 MAG: Ricin B lectin [Parcubacteria group bacterium GW2011_GWA2_47_26]